MKARTTNSENAAQRATALLTKIIDIARSMDDAPSSPFSLYGPPKLRREMRRSAMRLRKGQLASRYENLFNDSQLADLCERTAQRNEMYEAAVEEFERLMAEYDRIVQRYDPAVERAIMAFIAEIRRASTEQGPGSDAARRYDHLWDLSRGMPLWRSEKRRQKRPDRIQVSAAETRLALSAAEFLRFEPEGETVIDFPEGHDYGRGRCLQRIGLEDCSWLATFALGDRPTHILTMMPGDRNLFVCAGGAGYIVDARSHALLEEVGQDVVHVLFADEGALFIVVRDAILETFDAHSRLWRTSPIGAGELRNVQLNHQVFWVQARNPERPEEWVWYEVERVTGEVRVYSDT